MHQARHQDPGPQEALHCACEHTSRDKVRCSLSSVGAPPGPILVPTTHRRRVIAAICAVPARLLCPSAIPPCCQVVAPAVGPAIHWRQLRLHALWLLPRAICGPRWLTRAMEQLLLPLLLLSMMARQDGLDCISWI